MSLEGGDEMDIGGPRRKLKQQMKEFSGCAAAA
jgi:hypothetical protein